MQPPSVHDIRRIFLTPRPNVALMTAADLLGTTLKELKRDIDDGVIVAVSTALGPRLSKEELIAAAMQRWEQSVIAGGGCGVRDSGGNQAACADATSSSSRGSTRSCARQWRNGALRALSVD